MDRQTIENLRYHDRPKVRCSIDRTNVDQDGHKTNVLHRFDGRIVIDENNPWLTTQLAGKQLAFRLSWGLLLEVLNDRFASPVHFLGMNVEYEV